MKTLLVLIATLGTTAHAATTYQLIVTNGSNMPLSPSAIYVRTGAQSLAPVGATPKPGFTALCQMGDAGARVLEVENDSSVTFATKTNSMIQPGMSAMIEIVVKDPSTQSLHFETMYGKTKDTCGTLNVSSHQLLALKQHATPAYDLRDEAIVSGAFTDPMLPAGESYMDTEVCEDHASATDCLRALAQPSTAISTIRFAPPYLPSVLNLLEMKYGPQETSALNFPQSGAIRFNLKLKH